MNYTTADLEAAAAKRDAAAQLFGEAVDNEQPTDHSGAIHAGTVNDTAILDRGMKVTHEEENRREAHKADCAETYFHGKLPAFVSDATFKLTSELLGEDHPDFDHYYGEIAHLTLMAATAREVGIF